MRTVFVAHHARSGIAALNVVSAALDADARTAGTEVRFARSRDEMARAIGEVCAAGQRALGGWSFYSTDFGGTAADLAWVRERTAGLDVVHVAGGVHATAEPLETLRAGFDLVALGEGERTIVEIVSKLNVRRRPDVGVAPTISTDPHDLQGIAHLDTAGRLVSHGPGERRPLDEFPAVNLRYGKWNAIEITRGCVYACSFCQTPYMFKARFRHRSVDNVRMHVRAMAREGARFQRFVSPTSLSYGSDDQTPNLAAVEALLAAVREEVGPSGKIYFGTFPSEVRPEHVTPAALAILKRYVDNTSLVIGGQSGSERVLRATRRGHRVDDVVRAVEACSAAGFRPDVDFLLGVPGETREDRDASLRLAERLVAMGARIHSHAFLPLPGTPLRDGAPEPIEPETARAMDRLESRGAMYGQWRRQVVLAEELVRRRLATTRGGG